MSAINSVALAGATGNVGPAILEHLLKAGFKVTVLTRQGTTHTFPESVTVKQVDYDSVDSLTSALEGQDALVSTLGFVALSKQQNILEAAIKAHVKRFLPSEFGCDTEHPKNAKLPVFADKVVFQKAIAKEAANGRISYTYIVTGPFFDWGLTVGRLFLDPKEKKITLYDGGERQVSTTTLEDIGKAVAGVLKKPDETKNRSVFVQSTALSLKQLKIIAEKITGTKWSTEELSIEKDVLPAALAELKKENPDLAKALLPQLMTSIYGEGYGSHFQKLDNELLGLKQLSEAEVEAVVAAALK
ncbi:NAD(P)-binding protein [Nemania sp. FL0916]|nr:NAD(P)-binding protein [Nemania sp. FL0916]